MALEGAAFDQNLILYLEGYISDDGRTACKAIVKPALYKTSKCKNSIFLI
jgi:hypothetical protein